MVASERTTCIGKDAYRCTRVIVQWAAETAEPRAAYDRPMQSPRRSSHLCARRLKLLQGRDYRKYLDITSW